MRFNVDVDNDAEIKFWITLDHPDRVPSVLVDIGNSKTFLLPPNCIREDLVHAGLHNTGEAGYEFSEQFHPELFNNPHLTISEKITGIPIYTRFCESAHTAGRVLILDFRNPIPENYWIDISSKFALQYKNIENFSLETIRNVLGNSNAKSLIAIGRQNWRRVQDVVQENNLDVICYIPDPFRDLARRILFARSICEPTEEGNSFERRVRGMESLDHREVIKLVRSLSEEDIDDLRSPTTYALSKVPEEDLCLRDVSVALSVLSNFSVVLTEDHAEKIYSLFWKTHISDDDGATGDIDEVASILNGVGMVSDLLHEDILLYKAVCEAIREEMP